MPFLHIQYAPRAVVGIEGIRRQLSFDHMRTTLGKKNLNMSSSQLPWLDPVYQQRR